MTLVIYSHKEISLNPTEDSRWHQNRIDLSHSISITIEAWLVDRLHMHTGDSHHTVDIHGRRQGRNFYTGEKEGRRHHSKRQTRGEAELQDEELYPQPQKMALTGKQLQRHARKGAGARLAHISDSHMLVEQTYWPLESCIHYQTVAIIYNYLSSGNK